MLPEFDHEMSTTRSLLERVPEAQASWKPHTRSMSMGDLSIHIARLVGWTPTIFRDTEFDLHPPGSEPMEFGAFESTAAMVDTFDANVREAREAIAGASDADMFVPWSLKKQGTTLFTLPRIANLRSFVLNHVIHHRGQLSVYLRLNEVPLPSIYGPTADTPW